MPEYGSCFKPENIFQLGDIPEAADKRRKDHDQPCNDVYQMCPGKHIDKRLRSIVVDKIDPPADQCIPGLELGKKEGNTQQHGNDQVHSLF